MTKPSKNFESVDAQSVNNTIYVKSGESIQTAIDNNIAGVSGVGMRAGETPVKIKLEPGATYDEGAELVTAPGTILDFNGAKLTNSADHQLLFIDNGTIVKNGFVECDISAMTAGTAAVEANTQRSTYGKYANGWVNAEAGDQFVFEGVIQADEAGVGTDQSGSSDPNINYGGQIGFKLHDEASLGLGVGCWIKGHINTMPIGIQADPGTSGFVNLDGIIGSINGAGDADLHKVNNTGGFDTPFWGAIQTGGDRSIYNEAGGGPMPTIWGQWWDPQTCDVAAIDGPLITVHAQNDPDGVQGNSANAANSSVHWYGFPDAEYVWSGNQDNIWRTSRRFARQLWEVKTSAGGSYQDLAQIEPNNVTNGTGGAIELYDGNDNTVTLFAEAGELKVTDNSSNTTTLS